jgi:hypothetical protein
MKPKRADMPPSLVRSHKKQLSARAAYESVARVAAFLDSDYALEAITSAEDSDGSGLGSEWTFRFWLGTRKAHLWLRIAREALGFRIMEERFVVLDANTARPPTLPVPFVDSPDVMAHVKRMMHAPPDLDHSFDTLSAKVFADGRALWFLLDLPPFAPGELRTHDLTEFYYYYVPCSPDGGEPFCVPMLEDTLQ